MVTLLGEGETMRSVIRDSAVVIDGTVSRGHALGGGVTMRGAINNAA